MLCILFLVTTLLVLSSASPAQEDNSCRACNCQINNIEVLTNLIREEIRKTYVPWTPVNKTPIGNDNLNIATTLSYDVPSIIPNTAQGVLLYSTAHCGWSTNNKGADIIYYVVKNGVRYEHFLFMHGYPQSAIISNSDNMWFPMPSNRQFYVEVPIAFPGNCHNNVSVIGYQ